MKTPPIMLSVFLLTGCASQVPINISQAPTPDVPLTTAATAVEGYKNQPVRWGGSILAVNNRASETEIEVLAKALDSAGKPVEGDQVQGRFLARVDGFLDPAVYARGRLLTLYGLLENGQTRNIGEKAYTYPLIKVQTQFLWPLEPVYANSAYCGYGGYYRPYGYYSSFGYYPGRSGYGFGGYRGRRW